VSKSLEKVLIAGITPYFLDKGNFWFEKNLKFILKIKETQPFFKENIVFVKKNQKISFSFLLKKLDEMGYEKVQKVEEIGEFSQRGGVIDVFPINMKNAIRLDFFGNRIENIEILNIFIEDEKKAKESLRKKLKSQKLFSDLRGLKPGDYIVHLDHGIGKFTGFSLQPYFYKNKKGSGSAEKYYVIEYAKGDKLFVPIGLERKLSRYIGFLEPKISRLSSPFWQKTKRKIKKETIKLAKELLELYAKRTVSFRKPYLPEDEFDSEISSSFKYQETPDQKQAIQEIKEDLEKEKPMDRLVCGDVGFGKTEVALRAAIKVVKSGCPVVMMCPTTILANQHFQTFKTRLKNFPIKIALLTRLQGKKEREEIVKKIKKNKIDIIIGTHCLLSNNVAPFLFSQKERGLLIIDDEQKFGVKQKEKLKQLRNKIDVLSLSATPIPRTLYLSLSSLKDMSLIQTPPNGRLPVKTFILPFSKEIIKKAIEKELKRHGQVYFLDNRVKRIEKTKKMLKKLIPRARFGIVHGKLKEKNLLKTMNNFQRKKIDVLIATTIIENGLDFANVNTLIVTNSEQLGLSQAYQIKGRIGRSYLQAFAYFLYQYPLSEKAKLRLHALKEAEELGSGYKIALKDLEIRGAGNILGKEQSGNINKVGLNLYCQLLSQAVEKLKTQKKA